MSRSKLRVDIPQETLDYIVIEHLKKELPNYDAESIVFNGREGTSYSVTVSLVRKDKPAVTYRGGGAATFDPEGEERHAASLREDPNLKFDR